MNIIRSRLQRLEERSGGEQKTVYMFGSDQEELDAMLEAARAKHPAARLMGFRWDIMRGGHDSTSAAA